MPSALKLIFVLLILLSIYLNKSTPHSEDTSQNAKTFDLVFVIDGDTLIVKDGSKRLHVRLIGIDAPEVRENEKAFRDSKKTGLDLKAMNELGRSSAAHLKMLVAIGSRLKLESASKLDRYGRTLAYVYREDGVFLNKRMLEDGYAYPLSVAPDIKFEKDFREAAINARKKRAGLWANRDFARSDQ
jgi:micrococcal nuclease